MLRISFLLVMLMCLAQVLGCREAAEEVASEAPPPVVSTDFSRLPGLLTGIQKSATVVVYEGLPSEFWEPEWRAQELARKETLDVRGNPVYADPLTPSGKDSEKLTELFSTADSYQPASAPSGKKCGGFSAEYCVEWKTGDTKTQLLICLECGDVMLFGPQSELHCDLSPEVTQRLTQLLSSFRKNPPPEKPGSGDD